MVASTSHPHPSHYKVHAGPCGALWHVGGGGVDGVAPQVAPSDVEKVRMSGSHWAPYVDVGEGAEGARGGQSLVSVGVGEDFLRVGVGCHERGFARRQGAHDAARTRSRARRRARRPPGYPQAGDRSSGLDEGTEVSRGGASAGTGAEGSAENRAGTRSPRGVEKPGVTGAGGGSPCRGLVGRSVWGRASAVGPDPVDRSSAFGRRGSR